MGRPKIVTLGAATFDVFLIGEALRVKRDVRTYDYVEQFPLGAKIEIDDIKMITGGGATNSATTFARQGFNVSFMGKIGDDVAGREIINELRNEGISTRLAKCDLDGKTGYSTILLAPNGERTVLVHRGVSEDLSIKDFKLKDLNTDWLYITSLAGNLSLLSQVLVHAKKSGVKVAFDPGSTELKQADKLKTLLKDVTVLKANRQELGQLFGSLDIKEILVRAGKYCRYVVITDAKRGSFAFDQEHVYSAGVYNNVKVVDRTGAGDAYGSGLVAMIADNQPLTKALTFASANATSVVRHIGAKEGILFKSRVKTMPIKIEKIR